MENIQQKDTIVETTTNDPSKSQIDATESGESKTAEQKPEDTKKQVEPPKVYPKLPERELKDKINLLRQKIEHDERDMTGNVVAILELRREPHFVLGRNRHEPFIKRPVAQPAEC